jgi:DnaA-homolog protein
MMEQLPLEISAAPQPGFDNYVAGANAEALERVRELAAGRLSETIVYLWGEHGSGRSHLLRAAAGVDPALVIADDVEQLDPAGQQRLFLAMNAARDGQAKVLAAGSLPPAALVLRDDLRTRLAWGLVYQLKSLSDADKAAHLRSEAARRGLVLSEELIGYLLSRLPRDFASLNALLDLLDRHSLARQRPLTLALVREALYGGRGG